METKVISAHVPTILVEKMDLLATQIERPRAWIIKQALDAWMQEIEERHQLTLEALADVDAGYVIDHQAVLAWADSLNTKKPLAVPKK